MDVCGGGIDDDDVDDNYDGGDGGGGGGRRRSRCGRGRGGIDADAYNAGFGLFWVTSTLLEMKR